MSHRAVFVGIFFIVIFSSTGLCLAGGDRVILGDPSAVTKEWLVGDVLVTDPIRSEVKPSMTAAPNGDLYVAVEDQGSAFIRVYRSTNGGHSWNLIISVSSNDEARNPSIAYGEHTNGEKWIYVAYEAVTTADDTRSVMVFRLASDVGAWDWTTVAGPFIMAGAADEVHPQITTDWSTFGDSYYMYLTWAAWAIDYYPVFSSRTTDRGVTWLASLNVTGGSENTAWATRPEIAFGSSGLFIAFVKPGWNGASWTNQIWVTESNNFGAAFSTPIQVTDTASNKFHPAVAAAYDVSSIVVAYTGDLGDLDVRFVTSTDGGANWGGGGSFNGWTLNEESAVDLAVSNSGGQFHAAYHHELTAGGDNQTWYSSMSTASPTTWSAPQVINDGNSASGLGFYPRPTITVNPAMPAAEEAAVAWADFRGGGNYEVYFDSAGLAIFSDDFESGDTTRWSATIP